MRVKPIFKEKLLCQHGSYFYCYRNGKIILRDYESKKIIKVKRFNSILKSNFFIERLLRYEPRIAFAISDDEIIFSCHGKMYHYSATSNNVEIDYKFVSGMNNPLSCCVRYSNSFEVKEVLYGEYIQNQQRGKVCIYRRENSKWSRAFEFKEKTIKHIHNIIDDREKNRFLILTGDDDDESGIWESDYNFANVQKIEGGSQQYRACVLLSTSDNQLYYPTDTPLEQNFLYKLNEGGGKEVVSELSGPVIYGRVLDNRMFFSTSVEADSRKSGINYLLSNRIGPGVKDKFSHLYCFDSDGEIKEICKIKKDIYPLVLFGFGTIKFPNSDDGNIYICPQSLDTMYGTYIIEENDD